MKVLYKLPIFKSILELDNFKIKIKLLSIVLFLFFLPINEKISTILIIVSTIISLLSFRKENLLRLKNAIPLFILFFIYSVAFYRGETRFGIYMFEQKASLIAFPIIFLNLKISKERLLIILKAFVYACLISYILLFLKSLWNCIDLDTLSFNPIVDRYRGKTKFIKNNPLLVTYLFGKNFSQFIQTTYLALYFNFSILIVYCLKDFFSKKIKFWFFLLLIIGVIQLFSEIGIITLLLLLTFIAIRERKKRYLLLIIIPTVLFLAPNINRFHQLYTVIVKNEQEGFINQDELGKINERLVVWDASIKLIKKEPIVGYGVKAAQDKLNSIYIEGDKYAINALNKKLNAHNQYFQITLEAGLIGFLLLIIIITNYILTSKRIKDNIKYITFGFMGMIVIVFFTESLLNRYIGISFFSFFYCLLMSYSSNFSDKK